MRSSTKRIPAFIFTFIVAIQVLRINAYAYIDPSITTYTIQAVAGVVIAIGAVAGIYFRKAKRKINKTLNIDENKNKEVESDEIIISKADKKE